MSRLHDRFPEIGQLESDWDKLEPGFTLLREKVQGLPESAGRQKARQVYHDFLNAMSEIKMNLVIKIMEDAKNAKP